MKYITIKLTENHCSVNDGDFYYNDSDMSKMASELARYLRYQGWPLNKSTHKVEVLAFGNVDYNVLTQYATLFRYIEFLGGIHNPGILFLNKEGFFRTGEASQLIRNYISLRLT